MFAGVYHWFPKMYGRMMNKYLGYIHFWGTFICAYGVFFPMHFLGLAGLPRRYYNNESFSMFDGLADININKLISFHKLMKFGADSPTTGRKASICNSNRSDFLACFGTFISFPTHLLWQKKSQKKTSAPGIQWTWISVMQKFWLVTLRKLERSFPNG